MFPPTPRAALRLVAVQMLVFTGLRAVFFGLFRSSAGPVDGLEIVRAFGLGARFDLRLALLVVLPLLVLALVPALRPQRPAGRSLWMGWIIVSQTLLLLVSAFDLGHYDYLHERLDAKVLDELRSPREAAGMIWETYPVLPGLLGLAALAGGWWLVSRWVLLAAAARPVQRRAVGVTVASMGFVLGIYGNLSWYPLRWSQAFFSTDPFVSALASNPVLYFAETLANKGPRPDRAVVERNYDRLAELLEVDDPDPATLSFARHVEPVRQPDFAPNLVVIHLESWAAFQTGALGNPLPSSPHFDRLADESLLFTNFFVPSGPTARSVFSMWTGLPDVHRNNPRSSASRDPGLVRQPVLLDDLEGYETHYFLGGSANWANIRALVAGNVQGITIHEEGTYERDRVDVWGISDLTLFEEAVEVFDRAERPFAAFIQTSGNHRPYTIPERHEGFELADVDEETLLASGFKSLEAFNGFRFLDHSLGRFFELARQRPWYRHTVFALYGDHGVPAVNGIPFERIGLVLHHVPLVIHAPDLLPDPRRIDGPASSVDILTTCLSLMGVPHTDSALGRNLLAERPPERRFAFLSRGLVLDDWFLRRGEGDASAQLYRYTSEDPEHDWSAEDPGRATELLELHQALEDWALWAEHDPARRAVN
jgi:phosphoglycerol transferase MdoB-like AlkP superfamily enzyme